jgi:hypothetical protein
MSTAKIPQRQWAEFLRSFSQQHRGWRAQLQTHDLQTNETVLSDELALQSIALDLEDEKAARINVEVAVDNKIIKHILFKPSQLIYSLAGGNEALHIESVNTSTTVHVRPAAAKPGNHAA